MERNIAIHLLNFAQELNLYLLRSVASVRSRSARVIQVNVKDGLWPMGAIFKIKINAVNGEARPLLVELQLPN